MSNQVRDRAGRADRRARDTQPDRDEPFHGEDEVEPWLFSNNLTAPDPRPGYVHRWIRVGISGVDDATNLARSLQQGWRPRMADTVKNLSLPTIKHGEFPGAIGVHGMVLMERPKALDDRYKAAVQARTDIQTQAVAQRLAEQEHKSMPISMTLKSQVERGNGRRPPVMSDQDPPDPGNDLES